MSARFKARLARLQAAVGRRGRLVHGILADDLSRADADRLIDYMIAKGQAFPDDDFVVIISFSGGAEPLPRLLWSRGIR